MVLGLARVSACITTNSIKDPKERLEKAIKIVTTSIEEDLNYSHINEEILGRIVINESSKSFLTKEVDDENKEGYFVIYKRMVNRLEVMIAAYAPTYGYASSLASTILEGSLHQYFLINHFPTLTSCSAVNKPSSFITDLVFKTLNAA